MFERIILNYTVYFDVDTSPRPSFSSLHMQQNFQWELHDFPMHQLKRYAKFTIRFSIVNLFKNFNISQHVFAWEWRVIAGSLFSSYQSKVQKYVHISVTKTIILDNPTLYIILASADTTLNQSMLGNLWKL